MRNRYDYSAETEARPKFEVLKPLPPRKTDADGNFIPDPPLPTPYPGYSMLKSVQAEHEASRVRYTAPAKPIPITKKPKRIKGK